MKKTILIAYSLVLAVVTPGRRLRAECLPFNSIGKPTDRQDAEWRELGLRDLAPIRHTHLTRIGCPVGFGRAGA